MKKLIAFSILAALALPLVAQETEAAKAKPVEVKTLKADSPIWPAFFAVCEYPASPNVLGLRLTIPFSTRQEGVTGIDLGLWGRCQTFEGFQLNLVRNDVKDRFCGVQVGLYNSIGSGEMVGVQAGLMNEAGCVRGIQAGLVNKAGEAQGIQAGLINVAESMYGFQVGLINVIREAELEFCPVVNIGW